MRILPNRVAQGLAATTLAALLTACGDGAEGDDRSASGDVLEGTISDAMLPLDSVQSQAPRAAPETASGEPAGDADADTAAEEAETPQEEAAAEAEEAPAEAQ